MLHPLRHLTGSLLLCTVLPLASPAQARPALTVSSPDLHPGGTLPLRQVYRGHGCTGANLSPALQWAHAPAGTRSYAITLHDPDAPHPGGWWHWVVYDLPASATGLVMGAGAAGGAELPAGAKLGRTDFGTAEYGGAAPPSGHGPHRYIFTVFAVDVDRLDVGPDNSGAVFGFNLHFHTLAKATITATYENKS